MNIHPHQQWVAHSARFNTPIEAYIELQILLVEHPDYDRSNYRIESCLTSEII